MEPQYSVVTPTGRYGGEIIGSAAGTGDLNGRRVGFLWNHLFRGDLMFEHISAGLRERWPEVRLVGHERFENFHGPEEPRVMAELPTRVKENEIDALVVGVGACGSCTPAVMRACAVAERLGVPAVGLVADGFLKQARAIGAALGLRDTHLARYSGVIMVDEPDAFHRKVEENMVAEAVGHLCRAGRRDAAGDRAADDFDPRRVVCTGTLDDVQRHFEARLWTDGLPIIPPTVDRVAEMLRRTDRSPEEVLGTVLPANQEVTVWSVAVNGVLSGCDPRHLPLLIAAAESMIDPVFGIEHGGCTPGWEPFAIVSGPDTEELGFNHGTAVARPGVRANTTLGRFLRMFMRNLAGLAGPPGATDKATFGSPTYVALAEDGATTRELGWPLLREEQGFGADDTTVTVQSVVGFTLPMYTEGAAPDPHLRVMAEHIAGATGHWAHTGLTFKQWQPLLVLSPGIARVFAQNGMSKSDIRAELADLARVPFSRWTGYTTAVGLRLADLTDRLTDGTARAAYTESDDPDRPVPVIPFPERLAIVVAGDDSRNQSRYYANNHVHAPRVATKVRWPPA